MNDNVVGLDTPLRAVRYVVAHAGVDEAAAGARLVLRKVVGPLVAVELTAILALLVAAVGVVPLHSAESTLVLGHVPFLRELPDAGIAVVKACSI